jgi:hypothetical protein
MSGRLSDELFHFAAKPVERVIDTPQERVAGAKPRGFWVSVGSAWAEWCHAESFGLTRLAIVHRVVLAPDADILRLSTTRDLDWFTEEYEGGRDGLPHRRDYIDWARVADEYDGIIIAPYNWDRRMRLNWYYGWDVASGCLWNASAVESIEALRLVPESLLQREMA